MWEESQVWILSVVGSFFSHKLEINIQWVLDAAIDTLGDVFSRDWQKSMYSLISLWQCKSTCNIGVNWRQRQLSGTVNKIDAGRTDCDPNILSRELILGDKGPWRSLVCTFHLIADRFRLYKQSFKVFDKIHCCRSHVVRFHPRSHFPLSKEIRFSNGIEPSMRFAASKWRETINWVLLSISQRNWYTALWSSRAIHCMYMPPRCHGELTRSRLWVSENETRLDDSRHGSILAWNIHVYFWTFVVEFGYSRRGRCCVLMPK